MRPFLALALSAARQTCSEPLTVVLFLVSLLTVHVVPAFHFHEFGSAGRLATECGFSCVLVFGLSLALAAAMRTLGGEIRSGLAAVALARPLSRPVYYCGKIAGVLFAFSVFSFAVLVATLLATWTSLLHHSAEVMGEECASPDSLLRPGLVWGVCATLGGFILAALANRFARVRFCACACVLMTLFQIPALLLSPLALHASWSLSKTLFPASVILPFVLLVAGCFVFITSAGALSVRLRTHVVLALVCGGLLLSFLSPCAFLFPRFASFWLVDVLTQGGGLVGRDILFSLVPSALLLLFWLGVGCALLERRELA